MSKGSNSESYGLATAGLVLGIIGVVLAFIPIINNVAFILGVLALIFGIIALVKKRKIGVAIAAIVLAVASVGITLAMQKSVGDAIDEATTELNSSIDDMSGDNTESILENDVNVELATFSVSEDQYGISHSKLPLSVENKTDEKTSFIIQVEAVDSEGKRLADDTVYANDLNAGQSQDFEAFTLVQSDKYDALKSATFKIVSVSKL